MKLKYVLLALIFNVLLISVHAQSPLSAADIQADLQSRGVSQEEVDEFLNARGLSNEDLENLSPTDYVKLNEDFNAFISSKRENGINQVSEEPIVIEEKTVFENPEIVEQDTGENETKNKAISLYGQQLFKEGNFPLLSGDGLVPGTYILDVGDEISISIFGASQLSKVYTVNNDGSILYKSGENRVVVAGLSMNEAKEKLEKVFSRKYIFSPGDFNANVVGARTIAINIYGEVENNGGYILSAVNSPINAIQAAGGITKNGSYRNIRIFKSNGEVRDIDLYKYLNNPAEFKDIGLSNNDVIQVPTRTNEVKIRGAVVRPLNYELKDGETFDDLLDYAGGLSNNANVNTIELKRFVDNKLTIIDLDYESSAGRNMRLVGGDEINVFSLNENIENSVSVTGALNNPGSFELKNNMKVSDLAKLLIFTGSSKLDLALVKRVNIDGSPDFIKVNLEEVMSNPSSPQNLELQNSDELIIWNLKRFVDSQNNVEISGAIKFPGNYPYKKDETYLSDIVYFGGGLRRDASKVGMIFRKDPLNENEIEYIRINPQAKAKSAEDILIMPFDSIVILQNDFASRSYSVSIEGKIKNPGNYKYGKSMTVKDLLVLSGGFELSALTSDVEISRLIIQNNQPTEIKVATISVDPDLSVNGEGSNYILEPFDKVYVRAVSEFENQQVVTLNGQVKHPGNYVLLDKNEKLSSLIKRAGGLTDEAFSEGARLERAYNDIGLVVMNLDQALQFNNSKFNYIMKPRDQVTIPKKEDIVTIQSRLVARSNRNSIQETPDDVNRNKLSTAYFPNKRADYYIESFAGGFDEESDRKNVFVSHPNGEVAETKNYGFFKVYPKVRKGSVIVIPDLPQQTEEEDNNEDLDWNELLTNSVQQAMQILTLLILVDRV